MTDRAVRTALIISLLINAFLAAAIAVGGFYISSAVGERANMRQHTPLAMVARDLDPGVREQLKQSMSNVALAAAPDFQEARAARKHAVELAGAPTFDAVAVQAELVKARSAEDRGRAKLENGFIDFMKTQSQTTRATLARAIPGRVSLRMGGPHHMGPPPPDAGGLPPPPPPQ